MTITPQENPMNQPDVTTIQKGAGALYGGVAAACIATGVTGIDLLAYLGSAAIVSGVAMWADRGIRNGRASIAEAAQYADAATTPAESAV